MIFSALAHELAVLARDPFVVQPDADRRATPDDGLVVLQLEHLAGAHAGQHDQVSEIALLLADRTRAGPQAWSPSCP